LNFLFELHVRDHLAGEFAESREPVGNPDETGLIDRADIACHIPAIPKHESGVLRITEVAQHLVRSSDQEQPFLTKQGTLSGHRVHHLHGDARQRIGLFIDYYNFQRTHQGLGGLVPADRFFGAAPEVKRTLAARVQANALELARQGTPKAPFYLTGQAGGQPFSVHAEGERVILTRADGRQEIDLTPTPASGSDAGVQPLPVPVCPQGVVSAVGAGFEEPPAPGGSPLDAGLERLRDAFAGPEGGEA
jgi:hypothetical protein